MSKFFKRSDLVPYTPGEQPKDMQYIKLNTNESPFLPSPKAIEYAGKAAETLNLYPDPQCSELNSALAEKLEVASDEILLTNGSDEILNFAFMAFCEKGKKAYFPNITYGFYSVFADLNGIEYEEIPLNEDFTIDIEKYFGKNGTIFIANPNAPTGIALSLSEIEQILQNNPENVVVIDEAYVDFGTESAVSLIPKYDNLLVTQTFSKSRSMAGARLGFGIAQKSLIADLNTIKYSTNPYNINRMTMAAGLGTVKDDEHNLKNCRTIVENREYLCKNLKKLGFVFTDSAANFVFAMHPEKDGKEIYLELKKAGILVRHFDKTEITQYNRITIGTKEQTDALICALKTILEGK